MIVMLLARKANIYLTMLVNIGTLGLLFYLLLLFWQLKSGIKKGTRYTHILSIAIVCYSIQAFFNLSVVIVTPIFWVLLAIHYISEQHLE